ncbi:MAG: cysteine-rich KTR domain-containing protein [Oscillospiraceae bacterium]
MCPACGRGKVLHLRPDTKGENLEVYCRRCSAVSLVNIDMSLSLRA